MRAQQVVRVYISGICSNDYGTKAGGNFACRGSDCFFSFVFICRFLMGGSARGLGAAGQHAGGLVEWMLGNRMSG